MDPRWSGNSGISSWDRNMSNSGWDWFISDLGSNWDSHDLGVDLWLKLWYRWLDESLGYSWRSVEWHHIGWEVMGLRSVLMLVPVCLLSSVPLLPPSTLILRWVESNWTIRMYRLKSIGC